MSIRQLSDSWATLGLKTVRDRFLAILIVALLPAGLFALQSALDSLERRERLLDQVVMDQAVAAIQAESRAVALARGMLIAISSNAIVARQDCPDKLVEIRKSLPDIISLSLWDLEGEQLCASPSVQGAPALSQSFPDLFARMHERRATMVGYVAKNFAGRDVIYIAEPRFDARGRLLGAASLGYAVKDVLKRLSTGRQGYAFSVALVDASGRPVARQGVFDNRPLPVPAIIRANMSSQPRGFRVQDQAFALAPYHHPDLYVLVHADLPQTGIAGRLITGLMVAAPVLMLILTLVIVWIANERLLAKPLAAVTRTAAAYVARERPAFAPELAKAPEEIQRLDEALRTMAEVLVGREHVLSQALDDEKALMRELHHRVKNNLQMIISLLAMQARELNSEEAISALRLAQQRVYVLSQVHQQLYSSGQLAAVRVDGLIADLIRNVLSVHMSGGARRTEVEIALKLSPVAIPADFAVPLAFIATESLVSALEFITDNAPVLIQISLNCESEGRVRFTLEAQNCLNNQSLDTMPRLISAFCKQLGGDVLRPPPFIDLVFDLQS